MGSSESKESTQKNDNTGQIANNIIVSDIRETVDVHDDQDFIVLCLILTVLIIELLLFVYYKHRNSMKKQMLRRHMSTNNITKA